MNWTVLVLPIFLFYVIAGFFFAERDHWLNYFLFHSVKTDGKRILAGMFFVFFWPLLFIIRFYMHLRYRKDEAIWRSE